MNNRHKTIALLGEDGVRKSILPKFIVHYACVLYMEMASMREEKKKSLRAYFQIARETFWVISNH